MSNYNKSFNFRNGVQVDDSHFIVNSSGLVGIGTSLPTQLLDVSGNIISVWGENYEIIHPKGLRLLSNNDILVSE